jgi:Rod binding domain-containing protein
MVDIPLPSSLSQAKFQADQLKADLSREEVQSAKDFETVFLQQFVDEMMKTVDKGTGEKDGQMWRSFMSEAISKNLVDQGGLGLAQNVQQMMAAYKKD